MNLKVGDKIRILEDQHMDARVLEGDVLEVVKIDGEYLFTDTPRLKITDGTWQFRGKHQGTGWEKVED